jgi:hypothetical protein
MSYLHLSSTSSSSPWRDHRCAAGAVGPPPPLPLDAAAPLAPLSPPGQTPRKTLAAAPTTVSPPLSRHVSGDVSLPTLDRPTTYLTVTMERPPQVPSWGILLSLWQGRLGIHSSAARFGHTRICAAATTHDARLAPESWWTSPPEACFAALRACRWKAGAATFQPGDVIVAMNDIVLPPCTDLQPLLQFFRQATHLSLVVVRGDTTVVSSRAPQPPRLPAPHGPRPQTIVAIQATAKTPTAPKVAPCPRHNNNSSMIWYRNSFYRCPENPALHLPYADDVEWEPDEGRRVALFVAPVAPNVDTWLQRRKRTWRETCYKVYPLEALNFAEEAPPARRRRVKSHDAPEASVDFWTPQGFSSWSDWLQTRTRQWKQSYSWQRAKRQRIQEDVENLQRVDITQDTATWLRVRKTQWRLARRQRQRAAAVASPARRTRGDDDTQKSPRSDKDPCVPASPTSVLLVSPEDLVLDSLLEEQELQQRQRQERPPLDVSFIFDVELGCPDDVVAHCLRFLEPTEHGKLLALNRSTRKKLSQRETLWRLLCPSHWKLPRRPRLPWHVLYWTKLQTEREEQRKRWDDLLSKALRLMAKGDLVAGLEKLVTTAERDYQFDVNYSSGVVCERNALLNLAVIHQRHKMVRWLVEVKRADLESCDRGSFTPLLNAAWAGDKTVRPSQAEPVCTDSSYLTRIYSYDITYYADGPLFDGPGRGSSTRGDLALHEASRAA